MKEIGSRIGYITNCCYCSPFLQEARGDYYARVIRPKYGQQMVVTTRKGKMMTFMDRRSETRSEADPGQESE